MTPIKFFLSLIGQQVGTIAGATAMTLKAESEGMNVI